MVCLGVPARVHHVGPTRVLSGTCSKGITENPTLIGVPGVRSLGSEIHGPAQKAHGRIRAF